MEYLSNGNNWIVNTNPNSGGYYVGDPVAPLTYTKSSTTDAKVAQLEQMVSTLRADLVVERSRNTALEKRVKEQEEKIDRLMRTVFPTF